MCLDGFVTEMIGKKSSVEIRSKPYLMKKGSSFDAEVLTTLNRSRSLGKGIISFWERWNYERLENLKSLDSSTIISPEIFIDALDCSSDAAITHMRNTICKFIHSLVKNQTCEEVLESLNLTFPMNFLLGVKFDNHYPPILEDSLDESLTMRQRQAVYTSFSHFFSFNPNTHSQTSMLILSHSMYLP